VIDFVVFILALRVVFSVIKVAWSVLLRVFLPSATRVEKDYTLEPTVSILLPCYNEGPDVYESIQTICACDYPQEKFDVIATDDCSVDNSFEWIVKAEQDFPGRVRARRNPCNLGKSKTLIGALHESKSDIVIVIDSDCIFAKDTIRELVSCFRDPKMGIVGGKVGVRNPNDNILTQAQTFVYYMAFDLWKAPENWTRTVTCVGGYLLAIRRHLFERLEPTVLNRNWFGEHIIEGEDRFITHHALLAGYHTYINTDAQCWTKVPTRFPQFFKQQIRWRKSGIRDLFMTLKTLPRHAGVVHGNGMYLLVVPPLMFLVFTVAVLTAPFFWPLFWLNPLNVCVCLAVGGILHFVIRRRNPEQTVSNPLAFILFGFWWVISSLYLTVLSCLTLDYSDWGSRAKPAEAAPVEESAGEADAGMDLNQVWEAPCSTQTS
jgi:cellulose synthase/poly-beta-1,6-N-acetylglucosamine synthase-like glycosyltransferase